MERKEPPANQQEFNKRVVHYRSVPLIELCAEGIKSHIVSAEKITVSFINAEPDSCVPAHRHESEQITIVTTGVCDFTVNGKLYHLEEGDAIIVPANAEHGAYFSDKGGQTIDIFSPPRQDFVEKLEAVKKGLKR